MHSVPECNAEWCDGAGCVLRPMWLISLEGKGGSGENTPTMPNHEFEFGRGSGRWWCTAEVDGGEKLICDHLVVVDVGTS